MPYTNVELLCEILDPSHMYRHSLGGNDVGSPQQSSGEGGGEYHSSQGDSHSFRGLAPSSAPSSAYNSPSNSWGDYAQNMNRQGGGGEMGWNSWSPCEQGQRRSSGGSGYGSPSPRGGGQSLWSFGGGYDEQWLNQQSPWRRQRGELSFCVISLSASTCTRDYRYTTWCD